jgi:hypothetical protein
MDTVDAGSRRPGTCLTHCHRPKSVPRAVLLESLGGGAQPQTMLPRKNYRGFLRAPICLLRP